MDQLSKYQEIKPCHELEDLVHSFWMHPHFFDKPRVMTIFPDSFLKIVFFVRDGKVVNSIMTGLWTEQKELTIPPMTSTFGCRLKILAPEYLLHHEVASFLNTHQQLDWSYLNIDKYDYSDFQKLVQQWQEELIKMKSTREIPPNKQRLSQLLYQVNGSISALSVSEQIFWTNRQINRYMNKYIGVSLKKYLNIQKCYQAYVPIRDGKFMPTDDYFDQAHYIKEVKKHTGETPTSLFEKQNDRFVQLKNIKRK